jgi:hypothetical protein
MRVRVLGLVERIRNDGVDAQLDQYVFGPDGLCYRTRGCSQASCIYA